MRGEADDQRDRRAGRAKTFLRKGLSRLFHRPTQTPESRSLSFINGMSMRFLYLTGRQGDKANSRRFRAGTGFLGDLFDDFLDALTVQVAVPPELYEAAVVPASGVHISATLVNL